MKKIVLCFLILSMMTGLFPFVFATGDNLPSLPQGMYYYKLEDGTYAVYGPDKDETGVVIYGAYPELSGIWRVPDEVNAKPVTGLCGGWGTNMVTEVICPAKLKVILESAFDSHGYLRRITFNEGLEVIEKSAFYDCYLTELSLPDSLKYIGAYAFNNISITNVTIPESVENIESCAFAYCKKLKQVTFKNADTRIEKDSFFDTPWFQNFAGQDTDGEWMIYDGVLLGYLGKEKHVTIPDNVTVIESIGDTKLESVVIPPGVKELGIRAFDGQDKLETVALSEGLESIGAWAFSGCTSLRNIQLPSTLKEIVVGAFSECSSLEEIVIPKNIIILPDFVFYNCASLKKVILPEGLTAIRENAFENCPIEEITFPDTLILIDDFAFIRSGLKEIVIPAQVNEIGYKAFSHCPNLKKIYFEREIDKLQKLAFEYCENLTTVTGLTDAKIKECWNVFYNTPFQKSYTSDADPEGFIISDGVLMAYRGSTTDIKIPEGVRLIASNAFSGKKITSIQFPGTLEAIDTSTFYAQSLKEVIIPGNVKRIGTLAFALCNDLEKVYIEDGVKSIDSQAFRKCEKLTKESVQMPDNIQMADDAFMDTPLDPEYYINYPDKKPDESKPTTPPRHDVQFFPDITGSKYKEAIVQMTEQGIIDGYDDGAFHPAREITRAEAAKLFYKMREENKPRTGDKIFTDVEETHWAREYIYSLRDSGIINGFEDTTFRPEDCITCSQAVKMGVCFAGLEQEALKAGGYPDGYWKTAKDNGLMEELELTPEKNITREEMAQLLYSVVKGDKA